LQEQLPSNVLVFISHAIVTVAAQAAPLVNHADCWSFNFFNSRWQPWNPGGFGGPTSPGGTVKSVVRKFWADESGATAIEYGLIAAGISLAIIAVVNGLGSTLNTKFNSINTSLK
jgi:pilus assembly protein Flp/PilA